MRLLLVAGVCLGSIVIAGEPARADDAEAAAVKSELMREAAAWNRGDLDGYLAGYERAATTMMVGKEIYRGWDSIAAHYRAGYTGARRMGRVEFRELEVRALGAGYALAVGRWSLARPAGDGGSASGFFTLTLHKGPEGWRIIVDHTS